MSRDELHDLWCAYLLLMDARPDLAAQVYARIQEARLRELGQDIKELYRRVCVQKEDDQSYVVPGLVKRDA